MARRRLVGGALNHAAKVTRSCAPRRFNASDDEGVTALVWRAKTAAPVVTRLLVPERSNGAQKTPDGADMASPTHAAVVNRCSSWRETHAVIFYPVNRQTADGATAEVTSVMREFIAPRRRRRAVENRLHAAAVAGANVYTKRPRCLSSPARTSTPGRGRTPPRDHQRPDRWRRC